MGLLGHVTGEDSSLDSSTVSDCLIRVDALVRLLAIEEVRDKLDNTGDMGGTADEDDLVDVGLVNLGIMKDLLDRLKGTMVETSGETSQMKCPESRGQRQWLRLREGVN